MYTIQEPTNIDGMAAEAIRLGRELAKCARALHLGGTARDAGFVSRTLSNLRDRQPLCEADEGGLLAIGEILDADLSQEIISIERLFIETHFDERGQQGEMRDVPIHSERGKDLLDFRDLLEQFIETRSAVLNHIAAHRSLMTMMSR